MKEIRYVIKDELGIHARPAGLLVKAISKYNSTFKMIKGTSEIDAKSILGIMALGVKKGEEILITVSGDDETEASEVIKGFLSENL